MIKDEVLLILGAGSNVPYGFPTGKELRKLICEQFLSMFKEKIESKYINSKTINDRYISDCLSKNNFEIKRNQKPYKDVLMPYISEFCAEFEKSSTPSIDLFLSRNPKFTYLGKLAIVLFILEAEINSKFREKMQNSNHDWYSFLFNEMAKTLTKESDFYKFSDNKINIITFNYDRSLEHFLFESFVNSFGSNEELKQKLQNPHFGYDFFKKLFPFKFVHVYGKLSDLPWQSGKALTYGSLTRNINPITYIDNIHTIYEIQDNGSNSDFTTISRLIQEANKIFFLGFGFADENMESLGIPDLLNAENEIYATAYGFTDKEINDLYSVFYENKYLYNASKKNKNKVIIKNTDSLSLLREYL